MANDHNDPVTGIMDELLKAQGEKIGALEKRLGELESLLSRIALAPKHAWSWLPDVVKAVNRSAVSPHHAALSEFPSFEAWLPILKQWQFTTFPNETVEGVYKHLVEEVEELGEDTSQRLEIADCLMLLFCLAFHHGIDPIAAMHEKHRINLARKWESRGSSYRHVKDAEASPTAEYVVGWARTPDQVRAAIASGERVLCREVTGITWMSATANPGYQNFELFDYWIGEGHPMMPASVDPNYPKEWLPKLRAKLDAAKGEWDGRIGITPGRPARNG